MLWQRPFPNRKGRCLLAVLAAALGLASPATAAECAGDECQGPPPAPAEVVPGTAIVEGPQNPPVHFPKPHQPKKPKKHHGAPRGER